MHTIYEAVTAFLEEGCHCLIDGVHYTTATKLELPALGDGERKKVKEKLAEGYPEIKCKSGLHLFKVDEKTKVEESLTQFLSEGSTVVPGASPEDEQDLPTEEDLVRLLERHLGTSIDNASLSACWLQGEVVDPRAVQSLPHGMLLEVETMAFMPQRELCEVKGIGEQKAARIYAAAKWQSMCP